MQRISSQWSDNKFKCLAISKPNENNNFMTKTRVTFTDVRKLA